MINDRMSDETNQSLHLEDLLKTIPLFHNLDQVTLTSLIRTGYQVEFPANHILCRQGDAPDWLYVILTGEVRVYAVDADGNEVTLRMMGAGTYFGELALLDRRARSASIVCTTPCRFFTLHQTALLDLLQKAPRETLAHILSSLTALVRNMTERYVSEEQAKRTIQTEAEIDRHRALSQMVAGVAHELNTPLSIANMASELVDKGLNSTEFVGLRAENPAMGPVFDDVLEATGLIKRHLERAYKLVENFKRISVFQVDDRLERSNLARLVADVVELFSISARAARLQIQIVNHLPPDGEEWMGYAGYLTQVLLNLLTNVERYAYPGGAGGVVEITLEKDSAFRSDAFAITVRDHGAGMSPEHLRQIFDPFFTTGRGKGGTGLGMTIVRSLVCELMQGKVQVTSTPEEGTTVLVLLPKEMTAQRVA